jgi:hypothetical protein
MAINLDHVTEQITVTDTAANADLTLVSKGTGAVNVNTANGLALKITDAGVGTIENYWRVEGRNISGSPTMYVEGAGTNINTIFTTKGAGSHNFTSQGSRSNTQFQISSTTSAVNYVQVTGAATGGSPTISAQGSDANPNLVLNPKGTGGLTSTINGGSFTVTRNSGINIMKLTAAGTQNLALQATGGGAVYLKTGDDALTQFVAQHNGSAVNYLQATGAATTASPVLSAQGSDTNIDITFTPKGTGNVRFGTHTGTADTAISGYIEIKDSGGTIRKLAVIT